MNFKLSNTNISIALGLQACVIAVAFRLFSETDINAAIKNFEFAYGYFGSACRR